MVFGIAGQQMAANESWAQGTETIQIEREYNINTGVSPSMDRLPEYICREPLPPTNHVFDLTTEELLKDVV